MRLIALALLLAACDPFVEPLEESESDPCDEPMCGVELPPIGEFSDTEPEPPDVPSCDDVVLETELEAGDIATIDVLCPVGTATFGTCVPDGTGLIAAGFLVEGDDYVGFRCEVRNDSDALRVQQALVTCCPTEP